MKKILVLGGTSFVGRNIVEYLLLQKDCEISLFNRGSTHPDLFPTITHIAGDRNNIEDVEELFTQNWDCIIDVSCYYPEQLRLVLSGIDQKLSNYIFISTCSVYDNTGNPENLRNESAPTLPCSLAQETDQRTDSYGNRKAECERILKKSGLPHTIFRPALIYGTYDPTDRLYYWLYQVKTQKQLLLPEKGERIFSMTYIQDLVQSIHRSLHTSATNKVYNCISNPKTSILEIVKQTEIIMNRKVERINVPAPFLKNKGVAQWFGIPLWLNTDAFTFSSRALRDELKVEPTPFTKALAETIEYYNHLEPGYHSPKYGIKDSLKNQLIQELSVS
jgi:2'-hydroxyisoflavone reductase